MIRDMNRTKRMQFCGWILFLICAMLFIIESLLRGSLLMLAASLLFLVGCLFFVVPMFYFSSEKNGTGRTQS